MWSSELPDWHTGFGDRVLKFWHVPKLGWNFYCKTVPRNSFFSSLLSIYNHLWIKMTIAVGAIICSSNAGVLCKTSAGLGICWMRGHKVSAKERMHKIAEHVQAQTNGGLIWKLIFVCPLFSFCWVFLTCAYALWNLHQTYLYLSWFCPHTAHWKDLIGFKMWITKP